MIKEYKEKYGKIMMNFHLNKYRIIIAVSFYFYYIHHLNSKQIIDFIDILLAETQEKRKLRS
jgi:hypothetical protein